MDETVVFISMFNLESQKHRSIMYRRIRSFFDERGYLEIFTPTLSPTLIPESTIQNFRTRFLNEFVAERDFYLIPSPEIFMKEVLASGSPSVYQICSCFRNSEQLGRVHNPEFTMLEYYTLGFTDRDSIALTRELITSLLFDFSPSCLKRDFTVMSVRDAVQEYAGCDIDELQDVHDLIAEARRLGQEPADDESWDDVFNRIFITYVEPSLPQDGIVVLTDYPYQIECLASKQKDRPYRNRWEMYIGGMEVANCYEEETSCSRTAEYYRNETVRLTEERRGTSLPVPAVSKDFPSLHIPASSGVAIGLDRLLMCLTGKKDIKDVLLFPFEDLLRVNC